jgi:cell division protein FtsQ
LRLIRYDGTQYYLDQYGIKIPLSEYYTCRVPLANGNIFERFEKGDSVYSFVGNELFNMASFVDKHPFYKALIEQIFVRADNELILVPKIGSRYIIFGDAQNPEKKFKKLMVFYREGLSRIGWNHYKSIDLRFDGQVICKK